MCEPESELDEPKLCGCGERRGGGRKRNSACTRVLERLGEDFSWIDSDSGDDDGLFMPF
jgi:hypothetical protein